MSRANKWFILPLCIGLVVLIVGILLITVIFPNIIEKQVIQNVELKEDTLQWYRFKEIPFPFNFSVYLYEIVNLEDTLSGKKPEVKEVGPFVYKEQRRKTIQEVKNGQIEYYDELSYHFDHTESGNVSEDDMITVLNAPVIAILQSLEVLPFNFGIDLTEILTEIFEDPSIFITVKVKDLTFGGIKMCKPDETNGFAKLLCLVIMLMNQRSLEYHQDLSMSFSLFKYKTKPSGSFSLNDGLSSIDELGLITKYKGQEYTDFWEGKENKCDHVNGYFTTFPPFMEEESSYAIYTSDICKSIEIKQISEGMYENIPTLVFGTYEESFASVEDDCVCINITKGLDGKGRCYRGPVLDMSTCMGVPVILSYPHLMWAEKELQESILGLNNSYDKHNTVIDFEPNLGYPVLGNIRMQFNMILRPTMYGDQLLELTKNLPRAIFPLLWLDNSFAFTDELVDEVNTKLLDMLSLAEIVQYTLVGVGAFIAVLSVILLLCCKKK